MNVNNVIVLPVESSRLLAGKSFYNNTLQSHSREFFTLKGITKEYENIRLHRCAENKPKQTQFQTQMKLLKYITSCYVGLIILAFYCKVLNSEQIIGVVDD